MCLCSDPRSQALRTPRCWAMSREGDSIMVSDNISRRGFVSVVGSTLSAIAFGSWLEGCVADVGDAAPDEESEPTPNQAWEGQAQQLEAGGTKLYEKGKQWMGEDKAGTHVPQPTSAADKVSVTIP